MSPTDGDLRPRFLRAGGLISPHKKELSHAIQCARPCRADYARACRSELHPPRRRSRPRPSRSSWPAATSSASPRPAPARPRPSRCRSSTASPHRPKRPAPKACRVLVLSPTRELSGQIADSLHRPTAGTSASASGWRSAACRSASRSAPRPAASTCWWPRPAACSTSQEPRGQPRRGRVPRPRRSRPHARHGLHPRHPPDRRDAAEAAADAVLLGDHAAGDRPTGRTRC